MSTIKNQRCFTEATASARLILATGLRLFAFGGVRLGYGLRNLPVDDVERAVNAWYASNSICI